MNLLSMPYFAGANLRHRIIVNKVKLVKRVLPGKGVIMILKNEEVKPEDVLGKYTFSPGFSVVKLAQKLKVSPKEAARYLQRPIGSSIFKGELLALKQGLLGKTEVLAPTDGVLEEYNTQTGELRLKFLAKETKLVSGVYGIVESVDKEKGEVVIKTLVTEIFGIMGSGNERSGQLNILSKPGTLVQPSQITPDMSKHIVVAGSAIYGETLRKATGYGVSGIISGGINAGDFRALAGTVDPRKRVGNDVGISVLVTEGFGLIPIGDDIFKILSQYDQKFVFMKGNTSSIYLPSLNPDSILSLRKVALPQSKSPEVSPELNLAEVSLGQKVRVIWPPFMGAQGVVIAIDKTVTVLESGISTVLITIDTPYKKLKVPFANLEIIS